MVFSGWWDPCPGGCRKAGAGAEGGSACLRPWPWRDLPHRAGGVWGSGIDTRGPSQPRSAHCVTRHSTLHTHTQSYPTLYPPAVTAHSSPSKQTNKHTVARTNQPTTTILPLPSSQLTIPTFNNISICKTSPECLKVVTYYNCLLRAPHLLDRFPFNGSPHQRPNSKI